MLYYQNASFGKEGLNTHVMAWTMCISMSNFLDKDFYFDYEIPCSTPPDYASHPDHKERFGVLMTSKRSLVSQLMDIPNRRVFGVDRNVENKGSYDHLFHHFATTEDMRKRFEGTMLWDAFGSGRSAITREEMQDFDLVEWTRSNLSAPAAFFFLPKAEKQALLNAVKVRFLSQIEKLAADVIEQVGEYNAIHIRLGDFLVNYESDEYSVNAERFCRYVTANFPDRDLPVLIATDGLQEKELFARIFDGYKLIYIDELIFDEYRERYLQMPFTDFNVLTILNQLICAAGHTFIGTYRSTMTAVIHRLRQERYSKRDFNFFPDEKIARLLNDKMKIVPDRSGFFDWNRYSVLSSEHRDIGWRREWDHQLTMIDV